MNNIEYLSFVDEWDAKQKQKASQWYLQNRERILNKNTLYYHANKAKIKQRSLDLVACPLCGTKVTRGSLSHHKNNNKCKLAAIYYNLYKGK